MTDFGLSLQNVQEIVAVISGNKRVDEAIIFGSRAKGNFRQGSDVDIVLKGSHLTDDVISDISYILNEETLLPYRFDIINYNSIQSLELLSHIDRMGKSFYRQNPLNA